MKVELVGFSQGVSLADKDTHQNYFDFATDEGKTFRVPVSEDTLNALLAEVYGAEGEDTQELPDNGEDLTELANPDATVFGEESPKYPDAILDDDEVPDPPEEEEPMVKRRPLGRNGSPTREEDVPSL